MRALESAESPVAGRANLPVADTLGFNMGRLEQCDIAGGVELRSDREKGLR